MRHPVSDAQPDGRHREQTGGDGRAMAGPDPVRRGRTEPGPARPVTATLPRSRTPRPAPGAADPLRRLRRLGLAASLMTAGAALGAGALPVPNPLLGLRLIGLPSRNVTLALALAYAGVGLLVLAWLAVARTLWHPAGEAVTRAQLARAACTWAVPLAVVPPLFSRDVYSYLAQGVMVARGLDPYVLGPATALGIDDPLVRSIPTMWRDTPTPYGPLFLLLERGVTAVTGDDIALGVLLHRGAALAGVAAMVWALPRLAARRGVDGRRALWLGVANPLVLVHVISGAHNDGLMVGLFLVGLELGLSAGPRMLDARFLGGAASIVCASAIKLPALLVLGFLGVSCARQRGAGPRAVAVVAGVLAAVVVAVLVPLSWPLVDGWGWVSTLTVPGSAIAWMSPTTDLGLLGGLLGVVAGLGDHTTAVLALTRGTGLAAAAVCCTVLLVATLRGRLDPVTGTAAGLAAVVVLGPVVQPWYLLWIVVPLAATAASRRRAVLLAVSGCLAVLAVPTGSDFFFHGYQLPLAVAGAAVVLAAALVPLWRPPRWPARMSRAGPPPTRSAG
jgi:alpha-1,6-mannosyltransferase